jgi:primosomal protein N''
MNISKVVKWNKLNKKIASFSVEEAKKQLAQIKKAVESGQMTKEQAAPIAKLLMARIKKG